VRTFAFDHATVDGDGGLTKHRGHAEQFTEHLGTRATLQMVRIPGGTFAMGSPASEAGRLDAERPQHRVTVATFFLGKYAVTIDQWRAVMEVAPETIPRAERSFRASGSQPMVRISCDEAEAFCARLSGGTSRHYRLPSEAEWEFACRAGTATAFAFGGAITPAIVNHRETGRSTTIAVGSLGVANAFGLFDMHGNVWEWCPDFWHGNYHGAPVDGTAWRSDADTRTRVIRGGSWAHEAKLCRSAARIVVGNPTARSRKIGFRVAMTPP
jgi:formylglycine-generating enzyme required for sulfatase activity